jgi:hypothetical protein
MCDAWGDAIGDEMLCKTRASMRRESAAFCVHGNALEAPGRGAADHSGSDQFGPGVLQRTYAAICTLRNMKEEWGDTASEIKTQGVLLPSRRTSE